MVFYVYVERWGGEKKGDEEKDDKEEEEEEEEGKETNQTISTCSVGIILKKSPSVFRKLPKYRLRSDSQVSLSIWPV